MGTPLVMCATVMHTFLQLIYMLGYNDTQKDVVTVSMLHTLLLQIVKPVHYNNAPFCVVYL
jgi:hypothetical protein